MRLHFWCVLMGIGAATWNTVYGQTDRYVDPGGDDSSDCSDGGNPCRTLHYAVGQSASGDVIHIAEADYTEAEVLLDRNLTLLGESTDGTVIQGDGGPGTATGRVFQVTAGATVDMHNLTVRYGRAPDGVQGANGHVSGSSLPQPGGDGESGGGILNHGTLSLTSVRVTENQAGTG
ncbi:MAG: hypothetical protein AAF492_18250, partial [Verrucomicrobiota bacterium]